MSLQQALPPRWQRHCWEDVPGKQVTEAFLEEHKALVTSAWSSGGFYCQEELSLISYTLQKLCQGICRGAVEGACVPDHIPALKRGHSVHSHANDISHVIPQSPKEATEVQG